MSDPRRLRDDTSRSFNRALLDSASSDRASAESEERALAGLGLVAAAALTTATVAAASTQGAGLSPAAAAVSKLASALVVKWLGIGIVASVAIGGTVYVAAPQYFEPSPAVQAPPPVAPVARKNA